MNIICDCDIKGYPRPSDGNCSKCGYEMMDDEPDEKEIKKAMEEVAILKAKDLLEKNGFTVTKVEL